MLVLLALRLLLLPALLLLLALLLLGGGARTAGAAASDETAAAICASRSARVNPPRGSGGTKLRSSTTGAMPNELGNCACSAAAAADERFEAGGAIADDLAAPRLATTYARVE
jgi:hypothetical protein